MLHFTPRQPTGKPAWRLPGFTTWYDQGQPKYKVNKVTVEYVKHFLARSKSVYSNRRQMPAHLLSMLACRDDILTASQIDELKEAWYTGTDVRRKGVYIWLHMSSQHTKVYVGSFHSTSLFQRTKSHLYKANSLCLRPTQPKWRRSAGNMPYALYTYMQKHGLEDLVVFPLQLLPESSTPRQVLQAEQRWIDRFQCTAPHGYNSRNAVRGQDQDRLLCLGRYYSTRDMARRVNAAYTAYTVPGRFSGVHRLTDDNYAEYFRNFKLNTLIKLHLFCKHTVSSNGVSVTDMLGEWQVPTSFTSRMVEWMQHLLAARLRRPDPSRPKKSRKLLVCSYWTTVFDRLNFGAAFAHAAAECELPQEKEVPVVGFKYGECLGLRWCNHAKVAKSLTSQQLHTVLQSPCVCDMQRTTLKQKGLIPQGCEHVITCSSDILSHMLGTDCPSDLLDLFMMGPKHRPEAVAVTMSPQIRHEVAESLKAAFAHFISSPGVSGYDAFCQHALQHIQDQLNGPDFVDGINFTNANKPHEQGTRFIAWQSCFDDLIRRIHRDFVITKADKLPNNYCVVCKKHYLQKVLQDLRSGQFYDEVHATQSSDPSTVVADLLLGKVNGVARNIFVDCSNDELRKLLSVIPYEAALVKLHKNPIALRFLACSGTNGLKRPAVWLTALLRCVHPDLQLKWSQTLASAGLEWSNEPSWYAARSARVVEVVRRFNALCLTDEEFRDGGGWHGYDVVRLYTNIDLADLVNVLQQVLHWAWELHPGKHIILVYHDKFYGCQWYTSMSEVYHKYGVPGSYTSGARKGMYNAAAGIDPEKGKFYCFTLQHAVDVLRLLVENSYVCFAGHVFHQTRGIPMGINPAVYMANYYLFFYEFCFVKQLVDLVRAHRSITGLEVPTHLNDLPVQEILDVLHNHDSVEVNTAENKPLHGLAAMYLLHQFRCTVRFVDDFTSGPNPFTKHLLYCFLPNKPVRDYSLMGGIIKGIYPGQFLELEDTPGDSQYLFSTLDVQIQTEKYDVRTEHGGVEQLVRSSTKLYDKRRNECYRGIPIVQYTHVSSTLSLHCGYNILTSQLHRFKELIMARHNYVVEVARLLIRMQKRGYRRSLLFKKLKRHLRMYPETYGDTSSHALSQDIKSMYMYLLSCADWEYVEPAMHEVHAWTMQQSVDVHMRDVVSEFSSDGMDID